MVILRRDELKKATSDAANETVSLFSGEEIIQFQMTNVNHVMTL